MIYSPTSLLYSAVVVVAAAGDIPSATADECLNDWGRAGEIVRSEKLTTVEELSNSILPGGQGQILKTTLCRVADGYVYRLVVRDRNGQLRTTVVPAKTRAAE